jgi:hypothetical protein
LSLNPPSAHSGRLWPRGSDPDPATAVAAGQPEPPAGRGRRRTVVALLFVAWATVAVALDLALTGRIDEWTVMTDELTYEKLATAIAQTYSLIPRIHGVRVASGNQVYPLLLAPWFAAASVPAAFHRAHLANPWLMASAIFPTYLLGREVVSRRLAFAAAVLSALVPWMVLTGFLLTEVASYPAFLWAMLAMQRSISRPSSRRDLIAVAAIAVAVLARTQFLLLAAVLPLAIVALEIAETTTPLRSTVPLGTRLLDGLRRAFREHRLLAAIYAACLVAGGIVAALGSPGAILGRYSNTVDGGRLLPLDAWPSMVKHAGELTLACGVIPVVLGCGWALAALAAPNDRRSRSLAILFAITTIATVAETASFVVRFLPPGEISERYVFYLGPLALVGTAAALGTTAPRRVAAGALASLGLALASLPLLSFPPLRFGIGSPVRVELDRAVNRFTGVLGDGGRVGVVVAAVGLAAIAGLVFAPRRPYAAVVLGGIAVFSVAVLRGEIDRALAVVTPSGRTISQPSPYPWNWVDRSVPSGARVGMVSYADRNMFSYDAIAWWDIEFWNRSIVRSYVAPGGLYSYTGYPSQTLRPDWATGVIPGTGAAPPYVVTSVNDTRFQFHPAAQLAVGLGLYRVLALARPHGDVPLLQQRPAARRALAGPHPADRAGRHHLTPDHPHPWRRRAPSDRDRGAADRSRRLLHAGRLACRCRPQVAEELRAGRQPGRDQHRRSQGHQDDDPMPGCVAAGRVATLGFKRKAIGDREARRSGRRPRSRG